MKHWPWIILSAFCFVSGGQASTLTFIPWSDSNPKFIELSYKGIAANSCTMERNKLKISVNKSSSPIVFPFDSLGKIHRLKVVGEIISLPKFSDVDDFILRVGPAFSGRKTLSGLQKLFAPDWIVQMNKLAEARKVGFGGLDLSLVAPAPGPKWKSRQHPKSELIQERIALVVKTAGKFEFEEIYAQSKEPALGLWLGADGDDGQTNFVVEIDKLELEFY